jgi:tetratricopeptide (TPR) repeat protein
LALAICGNTGQAERLAAEASETFPNGTVWNAVQLPEIRALIALTHNQPAKSVELLASASPYERSCIDASYFRGLAYLRLHRGVEAVAEFRKVIDHKGANWYMRLHTPGQYYALSYLGMARGFGLTGDIANARKAYEEFLELWKNADRDIPIFKQAKTEYARLG